MGVLNYLYKNLSISKIERRAILVVIGDSGNYIATFISYIVLVRIIPYEMIGTFRQVTFISSLFATFFNLALSNSIYRFWNVFSSNNRQTYIKMTIIMSFILAIISSLFLFIIAMPISILFKNQQLGSALVISSFIPVGYITFSMVRPILICKGFSIKATLVEGLVTFISFCALIIPILYGKEFFLSLIMWVSCSVLVRFLFFIYILKDYIFADKKWWDSKIFYSIWNFTWPIQLARIPSFFITYFDKIYSSYILSTKEFAIYSIGAREIPFLSTIGYSVSNVMIPEMTCDLERGDCNSIAKRFRNSCIKTSIIIYPIAAFCICFVEPIIKLLYSTDYLRSSIPFTIFAFVSFIRITEYGSIAKVYGNTKLILHSVIISSVSIIIFSIIGGYFFKSTGIAFAYLLSTIISSLYLIANYSKEFGNVINNIFPWKILLLLFGISFTGVGIIKFISISFINFNTSDNIFTYSWKLTLWFIMSFFLYTSTIYIFQRFLKIKII